MNSHRILASALTLAALAPAAPAVAANPWADSVVSYAAGSGAGTFTNSAVALGEPTRYNNDLQFGGSAVTPFNAPYLPTDVVRLGNGGSLTVAFDEPVVDDPLNPFGLDLLIFGNAFFELDFGSGLATGVTAAEGGLIEVSANGVDFVPVPGVEADGRFPTLGYSDVTESFPPNAGAVVSDFTRPVNPAFDATGLGIAAIVAAYQGSGGGVGVDLAVTGLAQISYVRISNPNVAGTITPEIDAFADVTAVPEPASWLIFFVGAHIFLGKSVRAGNVKEATGGLWGRK
jgi:hypothetical protein